MARAGAPRRVLQVMGRSAGGIARHVAHITQALNEDGLQVDVAGPARLPLPMPKPLIELDIPDGVRGHRRARRRIRQIARDGYGVVHAHGLRAGVDAGASRNRSYRVVATVHNLVRPEIAGRVQAPLYRMAERLVVRLCDRVLCVSEDIASDLRERARRHDLAKIEVLYLGLPELPQRIRTTEEVRAELGLAPYERLVVTASRLAPQKAVDVLLAAIHHLSRRIRVRVAILGEGPSEPELRALTRRLRLDDVVSFLGFRSDVVDFIAAADVFCLSSVWEGVPLSVQEAVLLETPVVATAVGGMSEIISDGRSGRLVPPNDALALAAALERVLSSPQEAARFVVAAKAHLLHTFSSERMLQRLREIYLEDVRA